MTELGVDVIELYQHHRHDPNLSYLQQIQALQLLIDRGLVRRIGLSNVTLPELDLAIEELGGPREGGRRVSAERTLASLSG